MKKSNDLKGLSVAEEVKSIEDINYTIACNDCSEQIYTKNDYDVSDWQCLKCGSDNIIIAKIKLTKYEVKDNDNSKVDVQKGTDISELLQI